MIHTKGYYKCIRPYIFLEERAIIKTNQGFSKISTHIILNQNPSSHLEKVQ